MTDDDALKKSRDADAALQKIVGRDQCGVIVVMCPDEASDRARYIIRWRHVGSRDDAAELLRIGASMVDGQTIQ